MKFHDKDNCKESKLANPTPTNKSYIDRRTSGYPYIFILHPYISISRTSKKKKRNVSINEVTKKI